MKITFNDASEMTIQSATVRVDGSLLIKTISATEEELRNIFRDTFRTKKMVVTERESTVAEYEGYTNLNALVKYTGGILGVVQYKQEEAPEVQKELQNAAIMVAQIQAQSFTDTQALIVQAIYPEWSGDGVEYSKDYKIRYNNNLYKCIQAHTSQDTWTPLDSPSLFSKVLIPDSNVIPEWEQPDSTNPYAKGDKVTHNGKIWQSTTDNNIWEPGVYGWEEVHTN